MKEQDCSAVYDDLIEMLEHLSLGWIAGQVAEVINTGRVVEEIVSGRKSPDLKLSYHTPSEQLLLLIGALEKAIVDSMEIELDIAEAFIGQANKLTSPEIHFIASLSSRKSRINGADHTLAQGKKQLKTLKNSFNQLKQKIAQGQNSSLVETIRDQLEPMINSEVQTLGRNSNLYKYYIFNLILKAAQNEGARIYYQDVLKHSPEQLIFREHAGQIDDTSHGYTHAVIEFENKPVLELHIGVKAQGRLRVLYDCDICILYKIEAERCRENQRIPRASGILLIVDCQNYTAELPLATAQAFIALSSELRLTGGCYFVSNSASDSVAKLLASRKRKWDYNIIPSLENNVNRLMYDFQGQFKDFKARH
ncbi:MAG: hypothetical protein HC835_01680 [Oscillatoriales cyanobacterium RM2_1_1]|nr:hypothetical protein [Oscillatoriales cyanobacterium SM2_3_0]NJO44436.1 hypothetical protein [Oscillatoriales cyanobacterium RM2_1_1]